MPGKNRQTPPRHLLVFRTSAMGDVAMLAHAVRALKSAYPALRVTVATQAIFRPFFAGLEVGFLTVAVKGPHHSLYGMWRLAATAKRLGVDAVADVHGTLRSKTFGLAERLRGVPRGGHPEGPRRETRVHPLRRPRRRTRASHRTALLRRLPAARIRIRRSRAGGARRAAQSVRSQTGRLGRIRSLLGPAG